MSVIVIKKIEKKISILCKKLIKFVFFSSKEMNIRMVNVLSKSRDDMENIRRNIQRVITCKVG